jgi:hypothetical protein
VGIIYPNRHDVFISYAHDDNKRHSNYVTNFRDQLLEMFGAEMRSRVQKSADADIFIDEDGLPLNGPLSSQIEAEVQKSVFLFIFLSKCYLQSDYCKHELDWFKKSYGGSREQAIKHTFILLLEKEAEQRCWGEFLELNERPIYIPFFDKKLDRPLPIFMKPNVLERAFQDQMDRLVEQLADRAEEKIGHDIEFAAPRIEMAIQSGASDHPNTQPLVCPLPAARNQGIALGVVTDDLLAVRSNLAKQLQGLGIESVELELADISSGKLPEKIANCQLFVQAFSYAPVLLPFEIGGHLMAQEKYLGGRDKIVWWHPQEEENVVTRTDASKAEKKDDQLAYLDALEKHSRRGNVSAFLTQITGGATEHERPIVYIESNKNDRQATRSLRKHVVDLWQERYSDKPPLRCFPLSLAHLEKMIERCHGIILVYGSKDEDALWTQVTKIEDLLERLNLHPSRAIAVVPPNTYEGDLYWYTFEYRNESDQAKIVEDDLVAMLDKISEQWEVGQDGDRP